MKKTTKYAIPLYPCEICGKYTEEWKQCNPCLKRTVKAEMKKEADQ